MKEVYIKHIRTFLSACKLRNNLLDLLKRYNVESLDELSEEHAFELYKWLEVAHRAMTTEPTSEVRRLRSKVLTLLSVLGVGKGNNWTAINAYLLQPKISGTLLYMMNATELRTLERKLYSIAEKATKPTPRPEAIPTPIYRPTQPS